MMIVIVEVMIENFVYWKNISILYNLYQLHAVLWDKVFSDREYPDSKPTNENLNLEESEKNNEPTTTSYKLMNFTFFDNLIIYVI